MNNFWSIIIIGAFIGLINQVSLSLGITTDIWANPTIDTEITEGGFLEGLLSMARWGVNNVGSLIQLISFQAEVPNIINALILTPIGLGIFYLVYVMIRGGAS